MSLTFENIQHGNLKHTHEDRCRQFESRENNQRPLVDMANPTEARLAGGMSKDFGRHGELALPQTGHLRFDDPYASAVSNGSAENSFPGEQHLEQQLVKLEKESSNLFSFLERYDANQAPDNASTTPPMDTPPATTANNVGAESQDIPPSQIPPTQTSSDGGATAAPAGSDGSASKPSNNSSSENTTPPVTTNSDTKSDTATGSTTGGGSGFQVNDGKLTYNGETLAGVNVSSDYFQKVGAQTVANQLAGDFPGINVVRLETSPDGAPGTADGHQGGQTTTEIQADIQALNAKGIGVIIDNHAAYANNANNVSLDGNEPQWFSTLAKQNLGNNNVMFQPENEPTGSNQDIVNEQVAAYNAIRATGSNNVVAFDLEGGYNAAPQLSDPSAYDSMSNYVIDAHAYVADSQPITDMQSEAVQTASLKEANGQAVPVYFGETGNSIDGTQISSAANQLLQTEFTDGNGAVAFAFDHDAFVSPGTSQANNMTDPNGNLNAYGQFIASLIQQSSNSANNT